MSDLLECIVQAEQGANLVVSDLRQAYSKSEYLTEIIIMPLLQDAIDIEKKLKTLKKALEKSTK